MPVSHCPSSQKLTRLNPAQVAFSGIGSLSMAAIKRARADYEGVVLEQMAEHRRRLEDLLSSPKLADGHHASGETSFCGLHLKGAVRLR